MNLIVWLVLGGLLGALASILVKGRAQPGLTRNIMVGIAGAVLGGWLLSLLIGAEMLRQGELSMASLMGALVACTLLLAVVNMFNRGTAR